MIHDPAIATAADYADALMTSRRAKSLLVLILVLLLLIQLTIFFVAKYTDVIPLGAPSAADAVAAAAATPPSTNPAPITEPRNWSDLLKYLTGLSAFLGVTLAIVLSLVIYLIVQIMLVGRLIGVARTTSAFIWALIVIVLLFPWQSFLATTTFDNPSFKVPGVLYTWDELRANAKLGMSSGGDTEVTRLILHWGRFVAMPLVAIVLLLMIQVKSNRGLRQALGEDTSSQLDTTDTTAASV